MFANGFKVNSYFKKIDDISNIPMQKEFHNESARLADVTKSFVKKIESKKQKPSKPIASFKIEISQDSFQLLKIFKWDSIKDVAFKFCKSHKLDCSFRDKLIEIITNHMCLKDLKELVQ